MLKPERKAQWCGHDGASEFGPPGLSAAVHVWGSDPVPQLTHAALGLEPGTARSALGLLLTRPGPVSGGQAGRALVTIGILPTLEYLVEALARERTPN